MWVMDDVNVENKGIHEHLPRINVKSFTITMKTYLPSSMTLLYAQYVIGEFSSSFWPIVIVSFNKNRNTFMHPSPGYLVVPSTSKSTTCFN